MPYSSARFLGLAGIYGLGRDLWKMAAMAAQALEPEDKRLQISEFRE